MYKILGNELFFTLAYVARGLYHAGADHVGIDQEETGSRAVDGARAGSRGGAQRREDQDSQDGHLRHGRTYLPVERLGKAHHPHRAYGGPRVRGRDCGCFFNTTDAADDLLCVDLGDIRIVLKKN